MNSYYHAKSSAKRFGGEPEDYLEIHNFIDSSKRIIGDVRHRSIYHHTEGIFLCAQIFGTTLAVKKKNSVIEVPVRLVAEHHVLEDLGWIPSPVDYIKNMPVVPWMSGSQRKDVPLSHLLKDHK